LPDGAALDSETAFADGSAPDSETASRTSPFAAVERWHANYLPVYFAWALVVVLAFPPLFSFA
jgi:hypothetical protein